MAQYRIHRIKNTPRESFRWAAHTGGLAVVKPKDYEVDGTVQAASAYAAWRMLVSEGRPLRPGDLLETLIGDDSTGPLQIAKYIGFEPAQWYAPEPKAEGAAPSVEMIESTGTASGMQPA